MLKGLPLVTAVKACFQIHTHSFRGCGAGVNFGRHHSLASFAAQTGWSRVQAVCPAQLRVGVPAGLTVPGPHLPCTVPAFWEVPRPLPSGTKILGLKLTGH